METLDKLVTEINKAQTVALFAHQDWDGDSLGSVLALREALWDLEKNVYIVSNDKIPQALQFLIKYVDDVNFVPEAEAELAIVLDASDLERTSIPRVLQSHIKKGHKVLLIDHHTHGNMIKKSDVAWVDTKSSSVSEMVLRLVAELHVGISKSMSTLLLTGIVTDTSSFQNPNTSQYSLRAASHLIVNGARMGEVVRNSFSNMSFSMLRVWGLVMERLVYNEAYQTAITYLTHGDIKDNGIDSNDIVGIINFLNSIKDAKMVILMSEETVGRIKVSLRTRDDDVDVSKIARLCGGGGHVKAAGFVFEGSLEETGHGVKVV